MCRRYWVRSDEKSRHDDCRKYRRTRRNRLRYRKCRFLKDTKPEGWIAPSLRHKAEAQEQIIKNICSVTPIKKVTVEVDQFDPALLKAMQTFFFEIRISVFRNPCVTKGYSAYHLISRVSGK